MGILAEDARVEEGEVCRGEAVGAYSVEDGNELRILLAVDLGELDADKFHLAEYMS